MNFPNLELETISADLKLKEKAADAGQKKVISPNDEYRDSGQKEVIQWMENLLNETHSKAREELARFHETRNASGQNLEQASKQQLKVGITYSVRNCLNKYEDSLAESEQKEHDTGTDLRAYKLVNDIERPAKYPKWQVWHWAFVLVALLLETILNGIFFSKTSEGGLLGGVIQAFSVTVVNIGLGLLGGYILMPLFVKNNKNKVNQYLYAICMALIVGLIFIFNLLVAHYRVQLDKVQDAYDKLAETGKLAFQNLVENTFLIEGFEAWVLLALGLLFAMFAWFEGYLSDDPLREYGHLSREYKEAKNRNTQLKEEIRKKVREEFEKAISQSQNRVLEARRDLRQYSELIERSKVLIKEFTTWRKSHLNATNALLNQYQSFYLTVHQLEPKPKNFEINHKFINQHNFVNEDNIIASDEKHISIYNEIVEVLTAVHDDGIQHQNELFDDTLLQVEEFISEINSKAASKKNLPNIG